LESQEFWLLGISGALRFANTALCKVSHNKWKKHQFVFQFGFILFCKVCVEKRKL